MSRLHSIALVRWPVIRSLCWCLALWPLAAAGIDTTGLQLRIQTLDRLIRMDADSGLKGIEALMPMVEAANDPRMRCNALVVRADALRVLGRYDQAMQEYVRAHALAEPAKDLDGLIRSLSGMAITHLELNDLVKAEAELREALALARPMKHPLLAKLLMNLGVVQDMTGRMDSAMASYTVAAGMARAEGDSVTLATVLHDIAVVHGMKGEMGISEEYELQALATLPRTVPIDLRGKILITLGSLYADQERYEKALPMLEEARREALVKKAGNVLRAYHQVMAGIHRARGDTARLFDELNMLMTVRDSLEGIYRAKALADAEAQFGLSRMEKELELTRAEAEAQALRAQRSRIAWGALVIIATLALVLIASFHRQFRLRRKVADALAGEKERLEEENELLHQENLMARFETLKSQIDPHFLFNAMNTLYTLVESEPARAREFIASFSALYRKVLSSRDRTIVPVAEELELIRHYLFLQRIRFGDGLSVALEVPADQRGFLPPFTLQMLLENAIKHNVISASRPLHIAVGVEGDRLVVRNDLRPRGSSEAGTGTGLENIRRRYAMLGASEPHFSVTDAHYIASVPILSNEP